MSAQQQPKQEILLETLSRIHKKYVVLSGKGGVGKSSVSANLAVALAKRGRRVGLLDIDLHGPSLAKMFAVESLRAQQVEGRIRPIELSGGSLKLMSVQFLLSRQDDSVIWRGPLKHGVIRQLIGLTDWGELDYLIIDSPPGTGDEPLSAVQVIDKPDGGIIVTTPQKVSVFDVTKSVDFCRKVGLPIVGVVENMSGFVCASCGTETHIFGKDGGAVMAEEMGIAFLGGIPLDPRFVKAADDGTTYVEAFPESAGATRITRIAATL